MGSFPDPASFWLSWGHENWIGVTREEFMAAERVAGFHAPEGQLATSAFSGAPPANCMGTTFDKGHRFIGACPFCNFTGGFHDRTKHGSRVDR